VSIGVRSVFDPGSIRVRSIRSVFDRFGRRSFRSIDSVVGRSVPSSSHDDVEVRDRTTTTTTRRNDDDGR